MPCMCHYDPSDENKAKFKNLCVELIEHIKYLSKNGDPHSCSLHDAHRLLDHLWYPEKCEEKPKD